MKKKKKVITLEEKFDVIGQHEHNSNSKTGQDVGIPEYYKNIHKL